jgi:hypothetical protein
MTLPAASTDEGATALVEGNRAGDGERPVEGAPAPRSRLVLALLAGPTAASADMLVSYVLVYPAQTGSGKLPLYGMTLASLAVSLLGAGYARRALFRAKAPQDRFLAVLAAVLGAFFALVIVAFALATAIHRPTD